MKRVEYIQTDGNCYFPTNIITESGMTTELRNVYQPLPNSYTFRQLLTNGTYFRIGTLGSNDTNRYHYALNDTSIAYWGNASSIWETQVAFFGRTGVTFDGVTIATYSSVPSIPAGKQLTIFSGSASGLSDGAMSGTKLGEIIIRNSQDEIIYDLIPVLDDNNVPCWYDTKNDVYSRNSGSGTPTAGPEVSATNTIMLGTATPDQIRFGGKKVERMFLGDTEVYNKQVKYVDYIHMTNLSNNSSINSSIDIGITAKTNTKFRVKGQYRGYYNGNALVGYMGSDSQDYRFMLFYNSTSPYATAFDFNNQRLQKNYSNYSTGAVVDIECGNNYITDHSNHWTLTGTTQTSVLQPTATLKVNMGSWWFKSIQIWEGDTLVFDGHAALNWNNVPSIYDKVSGNFYTNSNLSLTYEKSRLVNYIHSSTLVASDTFQSIYTGKFWTKDTKIAVKGMYKGVYSDLAVGSSLTGGYRRFFTPASNYNGLFYDFKSNVRLQSGNILTDGSIIDVECGNFYMTDNVSGQTWTGTAQTDTDSVPIFVGMASWWFKSLKIWESNVLVFDGHAALDQNCHPSIYDAVSDTYLTNPDLFLTYEP